MAAAVCRGGSERASPEHIKVLLNCQQRWPFMFMPISVSALALASEIRHNHTRAGVAWLSESLRRKLARFWVTTCCPWRWHPDLSENASLPVSDNVNIIHKLFPARILIFRQFSFVKFDKLCSWRKVSSTSDVSGVLMCPLLETQPFYHFYDFLPLLMSSTIALTMLEQTHTQPSPPQTPPKGSIRTLLIKIILVTLRFPSPRTPTSITREYQINLYLLLTPWHGHPTKRQPNDNDL